MLIGREVPGLVHRLAAMMVTVAIGCGSPSTEKVVPAVLPQTTIETGPTGVVACTTAATFFFNCGEQTCTFECRLDDADWETCKHFVTYEDILPGKHVFEVRAADAAGNIESPPAKQEWTLRDDRWESVSAGGSHTCGLKAGGRAYCWGANWYGQLGNDSTVNSDAPVEVKNLADAVSIQAGLWHTCAQTSSGALKCWGSNEFYQLGDDTSAYRAAPAPVSGLAEGVESFSTFRDHTCALMSSSAVKCWGSNGYRQLGDGTTIDRAYPEAVSGLTTGVTALSAGGGQSCVQLQGGGIQCWGWNQYGGLVDGTYVDRTTPVDVTGIAGDVTALSAGGTHSCVLLKTGDVQCWGVDWAGFSVNGITEHPNVATSVGLSGMVEVAAGSGHTCARTASGGLKCWGLNQYGQLGDGSDSDRTSPVDVGGLGAAVSAVNGGEYHTCAILETGGIQCWGINKYGQLGDGTTTDRWVPAALKDGCITP